MNMESNEGNAIHEMKIQIKWSSVAFLFFLSPSLSDIYVVSLQHAYVSREHTCNHTHTHTHTSFNFTHTQ